MATTTLFDFIDHSQFWSSFFAQLLATFIVVIIGSLILPGFWDFLNRTKMSFANSQTKKNKFAFSPSVDHKYETTLNLIVKNNGRKTVERFYWEMYIEKTEHTSIDIYTKPPYPIHYTTHENDIGRFKHVYGYIVMPIFPLDYIDFVLSIKIKVLERKKTHIFYYFRSDNGISPFWAFLAERFKKSLLPKIIIE